MKKRLVFKGWFTKLLVAINILIIMTLTNNSFIVDITLLSIFLFNGYLLKRYAGKLFDE